MLETANVLPSQPELIKRQLGTELATEEVLGLWSTSPGRPGTLRKAGLGRTPAASALSTTRGPDLFRPKAQDEENDLGKEEEELPVGGTAVPLRTA